MNYILISFTLLLSLLLLADLSACDSTDFHSKDETNYLSLKFHRARQQSRYIDAFYLAMDEIVVEAIYPYLDILEFEWFVNGQSYKANNVLQINIQEYYAKNQNFPRKIAVKSSQYYTRKFVYVVEIPASITLNGPSLTQTNLSSQPSNELKVASLEKLTYDCDIPSGLNDIDYLNEGLGGSYKLRLGRLNSENKIVERIGEGPHSDFYAPIVEKVAVKVSYVCIIMSIDETAEVLVSDPVVITVEPLVLSSEDRIKRITDWLTEVENMSPIPMTLPHQLLNAAHLLKTLKTPNASIAEKLLQNCVNVLRFRESSTLVGSFSSYLDITSISAERIIVSHDNIENVKMILSIVSSVSPMLVSTFDKLIGVALSISEKRILEENLYDGEEFTKIIFEAVASRLKTNDLPYPSTVTIDSLTSSTYGILTYDSPSTVSIMNTQLAPLNTSTVNGPFVVIVDAIKQGGISQLSLSQKDVKTEFTVKYRCQNSLNLTSAQDVVITSQNQAVDAEIKNRTSTSCRKMDNAAECPVYSEINTYHVTLSNLTSPTGDKAPNDNVRNYIKSTRNYIRIIVFVLVFTCFIFFVVLITVKLVLCVRTRRRVSKVTRNTNTREPTYDVEVQSERNKTTVSIRCAKTPNPPGTHFQVESPKRIKKCQTPSGNKSKPYG